MPAVGDLIDRAHLGAGGVVDRKVPAHPLGHVVGGGEDVAGSVHRRRRVPQRRLLAVEVDAGHGPRPLRVGEFRRGVEHVERCRHALVEQRGIGLAAGSRECVAEETEAEIGIHGACARRVGQRCPRKPAPIGVGFEVLERVLPRLRLRHPRQFARQAGRIARDVEERDLPARERRHLRAGRGIFGERIGKLQRSVDRHAREHVTRHDLGDRAHAQDGTAIGLDLAARTRLAVSAHDGLLAAHHRQHQAGRAGAEPHDRARHGGGVFENDVVGSRRICRCAGSEHREDHGRAISVQSRGHGTRQLGEGCRRIARMRAEIVLAAAPA